jgi:hypothetical protein
MLPDSLAAVGVAEKQREADHKTPAIRPVVVLGVLPFIRKPLSSGAEPYLISLP